jgi:hypothetical protein
MDIPADADGGEPGALDELLKAAPSILDEMVALAGLEQPNPLVDNLPVRSARVPQRGYRTQLNHRGRGMVALDGPGSRTRAIGINDGVIGGNNYGDGPGNVQRDNMRHFGVAGTRSR